MENSIKNMISREMSSCARSIANYLFDKKVDKDIIETVTKMLRMLHIWMDVSLDQFDEVHSVAQKFEAAIIEAVEKKIAEETKKKVKELEKQQKEENNESN
jgi:hypothetical protein